jgi:predicted transcriptional regulator
MRDVLISLKPYYYYLIGEGIKKVEVRKSYPKAEDWSRNSWFYMSRDEKSFAKIPTEFQEKYRKHFGKVGMRFVCDTNIDIPHKDLAENFRRLTHDIITPSCLKVKELEEYLGTKDGYGWHITDLVVYDEPISIENFGINVVPQSWRYI